MKEFFYSEPFFENAASFKDMRIMHFKPFYDKEEYSVYDACARQFPKEVCEGILLKFNIAKIYLTGLVWQEQLFGMVGIGLSRGEELENRQAIESFFRQASIAMARRMTEDRLLRSEQRFREMITLSDKPALVFNQEGRAILVNPRFTGEFGYTQEDILNRDAWFEKAFPDPEYRKKAVTLLDSDHNPSNGTFPIRCRDGREKEISLQPVRLSDGTVVIGCDPADARQSGK
ncbi:MAG TPA: PAS domain S-box protein [Methanolinea sp.]|nr:PAS domain S-box protein [Methanolinea sp.]